MTTLFQDVMVTSLKLYRKINLTIFLQSVGFYIVFLYVSAVILTVVKDIPLFQYDATPVLQLNIIGSDGISFWIGLLTIIGLLIIFPFTVAIEECIFRGTLFPVDFERTLIEKGLIDWWPKRIDSAEFSTLNTLQLIYLRWYTSGLVLRSIVFGLIHAPLSGTPLIYCLLLILLGLWFSYQFKKGGVKRSTLYHLTYNCVVLLHILLRQVLTLV